MNVTTHNFRVSRVAAPLRQKVVESIREAIAVGRYKAGERLPERDLCEMTGVSRTLVREALRQLESERLITVVPNRGPVVADVSAEEAMGIYEVRGELEGLASRLFAENASAQQRKDLQKAFAALRKSYKPGNPIGTLKAKNNFYDCLIAGTANQALGITLRMLNSQVMLLRATSLQEPGRMNSSLAELEALVDALVVGNGPEARRLSEIHVRNAATAAISLLKANKEKQG